MEEQSVSNDQSSSGLLLDLNLALKLETLDQFADADLGIPQTREQMDLSDILNEDDPPDLEDNELQGKLEMLISADSQSVSSFDSLLSTSAKQQQPQQLQQQLLQARKKQSQQRAASGHVSGIVLHHGTLKSVANQLMSAKQRADAGLPTCITVGSYIAVGTAHGSVFLFDTKQALQWCLESANVSERHHQGSPQQQQPPPLGSVTALDFSYDMRKLLAGYALGHLALWDTRTGGRLLHIADAHPPGSAVLHVRYTLNPNLAAFSDSSGSVYRLSFTRQLTRRRADSACVFSGSRGEICALAPLTLPPKLLEHPLVGASLMAMASFTKMFLVRLLPELSVLTYELLTGRPGTLPQICWQVGCCRQREPTAAAADRDPCLVYGRDDVVRVAKVSCEDSGGGKIRFQPLKQVILSGLGIDPLLSLHFLAANTAVVCDKRERLWVLDIDREAVLEAECLNPVQLVYNSSAFKALATGSNVSQALSYAAETACYHSMRAFEGQLVVIGAQTMHIYRLRTWEERLQVLKQRRMWPELFKLLSDIYSGRAAAIVGLSRKLEQRRQAVQPRVRALLEEYLLAAEAGSLAAAADVALTACHRTGQLDWLFADLLQRCFARPEQRRAFLDSLRPFLVNSGVKSAPRALVSELLTHLAQTEAPPDCLEELLLHLDVRCLEVDATLQLAWQRGLYDAVVYVHTVAMGDPVTPLKQLLDELKRRQADSAAYNQFDASFQQLGGKALVHLSACLAGQPYFGASTGSSDGGNVQLNVFSLLVNKCAKTGGRYDNLEALCRFSIGDLLNFLALAFQEAFFAGEAGLARKQELLDDLVVTVADGRGFSPAQVGALFSFLVKLLVQPHSAGLQFPAKVFDQVLEYLCTPPSKAAASPQHQHQLQHDNTAEQQAAVIALLDSGRLSGSVNTDRLLVLAREAKFYRVCSHLYLERRDFAPVVECMLADDQRAHAVFDYVAEILGVRQQLSDRKRLAVRETCWSLLDKLVATDAKKCVLLVTQHLGDKISDALRQLEKCRGGSPELRYHLLGAYFSLLRQQDQEAAAAAAAAAAAGGNGIAGAASSTGGWALPRDDEESLAEVYLLLMSEFAPARLLDALQSGAMIFNPGALLQRLESRKQTEAQAVCHELCGQPDRALEALLGRLDAAWDEFDECRNGSNQASSADAARAEAAAAAEDAIVASAMRWLGVCADTCARAASSAVDAAASSGRVRSNKTGAAAAANANSATSSRTTSCQDPSATIAEQLWFRLLDRVLRRSSSSGEHHRLARDACRALVSRMSVAGLGASLPAVLRRLLSDPAYTADRVFGLQDLLLTDLLASCRYEGTLLAACAGLVGQDANSRLLEACRSSRRAAAAPAGGGCAAPGCGLLLAEESWGRQHHHGNQQQSEVVLFRACGHACHSRCLRSEGVCPACGGGWGGRGRSAVAAAEAGASPSISSGPNRSHSQHSQLQQQPATPAAGDLAASAAAAELRFFRLLAQLQTPDRSEFFDSLQSQRPQQPQQQQQQQSLLSASVTSAVPLRLSPLTPAWL